MAFKTAPASKRDATPLNRRIGLRLRLRRHELGLTQQMLADAADLTVRRLSLCEQGERPLTAGELFRVALRLGVAVGYFFDDGAAAQDVDALLAADPVLQAETEQLVRAFHAIADTRVRGELLRLIAATGGSFS